jgi:hypothetical protein
MSMKALEEELRAAGVPVSEPTGSQLLSWKSIVGFEVLALDGQAGTLSDVIADDDHWIIRYLVVSLSTDGIDHRTLVAVDWVGGVHEKSSSITLNLKLSELAGSPEYDPHVPINRDVEGKLYDYYGQPFKHQ